MILGIDASNLGGGSLTYLTELLGHANPAAHGFSRVRVWGGRRVLDRLPERDWLEKIHQPALDGMFLRKTLWKLFQLRPVAQRGCDVLFLPGGNPCRFHPQVAMCHNQLPFDARERRRYPLWSRRRWRLEVLRRTLSFSFRRANGVIFVTEHSKVQVEAAMGLRLGAAVVIPHGVNARFLNPRPLAEVTGQRKAVWRLLYVSSIDQYKHHAALVSAVLRLRGQGFPLELHLVGRALHPRTQRTLRQMVGPGNQKGIYCHAEVPHADMGRVYEGADWFVYPSACETFGLSLPEAMGHRMPIAASCLSALPEVLNDAAAYFNPRSVDSIEQTLRALLEQPHRRRQLAKKAFRRAQQFSWVACAEATLAYIAGVARQHQGQSARSSAPERTIE
jgi:glycosyltransferase involved in cell wall biosynthesis